MGKRIAKIKERWSRTDSKGEGKERDGKGIRRGMLVEEAWE